MNVLFSKSVVLNGLIEESMKQENIERMKVLDDETIAMNDDGIAETRDVVHYVGKTRRRPSKKDVHTTFLLKLSADHDMKIFFKCTPQPSTLRF